MSHIIEKLLLECLNALRNQTYKLSKIIVIDNHSTDETQELLNDKGTPVVYIATQSQLFEK